ncbi:MAG: hypothetical protein M1835_002880 [Candelina submexicana]|nr:MAG: hypothetical protein M1835_002880 [Candelina submexicana]
MSSGSDWSSEVVFSPSKARQQLAEAKDWQYIDAWLSARYERKQPPAFERNSETLKVLLALAAHNEAVDEENELLAKLKERALEDLKAEVGELGSVLEAWGDFKFTKAKAELDADILTALNGNLSEDGRQSLESIAALSVALGSPSTDPQRLGAKILELTKNEFDIQQQAQRVSTLQEGLESELSRLRDMLSELQSEAFITPPSLPQRTTEWTRGTKLLSAKLVDYSERLPTASHTGEPSPSLQHVIAQEQDILELKAQVKAVEAEVRSFHGLPYDKELALLEVERIRCELEDLKRSRDSLFEDLVEWGGGVGERGDEDRHGVMRLIE